MSTEEALHFADCLKNNYTIDFNDLEPFCDLTTKALEKQIPTQIKCYKDKYMHCPCCEEALGYKWEKYPTEGINFEWLKFCWNCGQALKWK